MDLKQRIGELEDVVKQRDRRIADLRGEIDKLRLYLKEMEKHVLEHDEWLERFVLTFDDMVKAHNSLIDDYNGLARNYNELSSKAYAQNVGRPMATLPKQATALLKKGRELLKSAKGLGR